MIVEENGQILFDFHPSCCDCVHGVYVPSLSRMLCGCQNSWAAELVVCGLFKERKRGVLQS